jgi:methyl-accepting chemotaxis protein
VLIIWLPRLRSRAAPEAVPADTSSAISELTRDLSYTTSHNALSAAGVAFSVKQLATNCNRNSTRRRRLSATPK